MELGGRRGGYQLLQKTTVQQAIQNAQQARSKRTGITQDEVIEGLRKEATREGEGSSPSARVAAWAHLGKYLSIFTDNLNLGGSVGILHEDALKELE